MDAIFGKYRVSAREFDIISDTNVRVQMRDGIKINAKVFRPKSSNKFPALIGVAPVNLDIQDSRIWPSAARSTRVNGTPTVEIESIPKDFFVRRGYIKVVASSRGTGKSEGVYQYDSLEEKQDIYDLIEWTARQPWCNGNVGMAGIAEFAAIEPHVAALQPPHLKAIAPLFSWWDDYRNFWWQGGILANGFLKWTHNLVNKDLHADRSVLLDELGEKGFRQVIAEALADKDIAADAGLVEILKNPLALSHATVLDILLHSQICSFWQERGAAIDFTRIKIPAFFGVVSHRPGPMYHWSELQDSQENGVCSSGLRRPPLLSDILGIAALV